MISEADRETLKRRADALGQKLDSVRAPSAERAKRALQSAEDNAARSNALGQALRISVDLVVGVAVGGGAGWLLQQQFGGLRPWALVAGLFVGFAAGMMNVIRTARQMQAKAEPMQRAAPSAPDDPDDR